MIARASLAAATFAFALAPACSSSSSKAPSSTGVSGTLGGRSLSPAYATAAMGIDDPGHPHDVTVFIANASNPCELLRQLVMNPAEAKADLLDLALVLQTGNASATIASGTYAATGTQLSASYASNDATCDETGSDATGGSVSLTSAGPTYAGTFDLTFGPDHVTGSFDAALCNVTVPDLDAGPSDAASSQPFDAGVVCEP